MFPIKNYTQNNSNDDGNSPNQYHLNIRLLFHQEKNYQLKWIFIKEESAHLSICSSKESD